MGLDPAVRQEASRALVARRWTKRQVLRRPERGPRRGSLRSRPARTSRRRWSRGFLTKETRMIGAEPGRPRERRRDALDRAGSPRLVLVREPDQLGIERAHQQLAFGVRLIELAEPNRHVAADDDRTPASLDDDHLNAACVARRRDEPEPGKQLKLAVDRHVPHAGRLDPLANGVAGLAARILELSTLDVDRLAGEEVVAAAVVEVQVRVDDDVDAGEVEVLLA